MYNKKKGLCNWGKYFITFKKNETDRNKEKSSIKFQLFFFDVKDYIFNNFNNFIMVRLSKIVLLFINSQY